MTGRAPSSGRQKGFTLVELLVVMALLSLLMLGLASAMSTVSQTQERVDARLDRMDHQRVSIGFLRSVLGQVSAVRRQAGLRKQGESELFFEGGPQGMRWLGIMPARFGMGGRTHFQLSVEGDALVLRFAPWQGPDVMPDWGQSQSYVIDRRQAPRCQACLRDHVHRRRHGCRRRVRSAVSAGGGCGRHRLFPLLLLAARAPSGGACGFFFDSGHHHAPAFHHRFPAL